MDFIQSDQFTQKVEQIVRNILQEYTFKKILELEHLFNESQLTIMQFVKNSFQSLKETLLSDFETIQSIQIKNPLKNNEEPKIQINQLTLRIYELEQNVQKKLELVQNRVELITLNKDELKEEIKSFDARIDSQWQGLANLSDQFWAWKKEYEPILQDKKKKFTLF